MRSADDDLKRILGQLYDHAITPEEASRLLSPYADLGFAKLDLDRSARKGFSEVIFGEGKTVDQIVRLLEKLVTAERRVLATRVSAEAAKAAQARIPEIVHNETARTLYWKSSEAPAVRFRGYVAVVSAGTADQPVAEEAVVTAEAFGCKVERVYDVGVAGIGRLFANLELIRGATAIVVVAGMEGALGSVLAGLVRTPIVAVPTSIGYGANFHGLSALLTLINACAPGISVVNIDNGFGAGYYAASIAAIAEEAAGAAVRAAGDGAAQAIGQRRASDD